MIVVEDTESLLANPPEFVFGLWVDGEDRARVFAENDKRNWVLWKLSEYVLAMSDEGVVEVRRFINGKWEHNYDWYVLSH